MQPGRHGWLHWSDWPWAAKLALLLGTLAIVPLSVVTLYSAAVARSELIAAARAQNLQQARNTAQTIDRYLETVLSDVRVIALAPGTIRLLSGSEEPRLASNLTLFLVQMRDTQGFDALYLTDTAGTVRVATAERFRGRTYLASRWFLNAISGNASFNEPRWDPEDRRVYIHASVPVRETDGRIVGTAVGRISMAAIDGIVQGDTGFAGRREFGVLWDSDGIRLSHPTRPDLRFQAFEKLAPDVIARLQAEQRFGPRTQDLVRVTRPFPGLVQRSLWLLYDRDVNPHVRLASGDRVVYASLAPLRTTRWTYGIFSPEDAILATVRRQARRDLFLAGLTAALAAAVAFFAAQRVTRPLVRVGQAAQALAAGDMSRRTGLTQRDEVGRLGAAFDAMADALTAKAAELREHADHLEHRVERQTAALRASEEELRTLYQREQELRRKAEEANRLKDEFLSTVSHELRTPLNAILGWTWLLASGKLDAAGARRAVATIERNARAQSQIIDDLLDVSRIITGKLRLKLRRVELKQIIEAATDAVRPAADAKGIRLEFRLDPGVPLVFGDPDRLQQIVWNLLSNAVKFTPGEGRVEVRLERIDGQARIQVTDTGIGIRKDFLDYVFDRFRQADSSTTRAHGGLGLGLSIVRHLVELHGGTARAQSEGEGQGATFTVEIPLAPPLSAKSAPATPPRDETTFEPDGDRELRGLQVLLVDDEPDVREMLPHLLEQFGASVRVTASAVEALEALRQGNVDVLVADIGMPEEDGYSLIGKVRELDGAIRDVPAIALTAYAGEADRQRALDAGFQMHLSKPVEPRELASAVAAVARRAVHRG
jgi:signal transduction histidine kinase/ActR/RegA family two-component response regulator